MPEPDLTDTIEQTAERAQSTTSDGTSVTRQPIPDLILADQYLKGQQAASKPPWGVTFGRIVSPGAQS